MIADGGNCTAKVWCVAGSRLPSANYNMETEPRMATIPRELVKKRSTRKSPRFAQRMMLLWVALHGSVFLRGCPGCLPKRSRFVVKSQVLGLLCQLRLQTMHYSKLYAPRSVWKKGYGPQIAVSFAVFWMRKWWSTNGSSTYTNKPMADQAQSLMLPIFSTKTGFPTVIFFRRKTYRLERRLGITHLPGWRYLLLLGFSRNMTETTSVGTWELAKFSQKKALQGLRTSSNHIKWRAQQKTGPSIPVKAQGFRTSTPTDKPNR